MKSCLSTLLAIAFLCFLCGGGCYLAFHSIDNAVQTARKEEERKVKAQWEAKAADDEAKRQYAEFLKKDDILSGKLNTQVVVEAQQLAAEIIGKYYPGGEKLTEGWTIELTSDGGNVQAHRDDPEVLWIAFDRDEVGQEILWTCKGVQVGDDLPVSVRDSSQHFIAKREPTTQQ